MILIKVYGDFGSEYKWLIKNGLQKSQKVNDKKREYNLLPLYSRIFII